jgi:hypothetical protein
MKQVSFSQYPSFRWSSVWRPVAIALLSLSLEGCGIFGGNKPDGDDATGDDSMANTGSSEFLVLCRDLGNSGAKAVPGKNGWLFDARELREIARSSVLPAATREEIIGCIVDYHEQLKNGGIDLILAPIPQKAIIYSEHLGARRSGRLDNYLQGLYQSLESKGVKVVDLVPTLLRERNGSGGLVYPVTANHLSPKGAEVVAGAIVENVKGRRWTKGLEADPNLVANSTQITLLGNLAGYVTDESIRLQLKSEALPIRAIGRRSDTGILPAARAGDGRILLVTSEREGLAYGAPGNPVGYDGNIRGSLADQLIYEFGIPLDVHAHGSSGVNTARFRLLRASWSKPDLLVNTAAIVWVFSANELTTAGWRKVPLNLEMRQGDEGFRKSTNGSG